MVKIPRPEPSVTPQSAMMPQLAGDGWGAPGRATQQLGQAIASLGETFNAEMEKEQSFKDNLSLVNWSNKLDMDELQTQQNYSGDGTDYTMGRQDYFDTSAGDVLSDVSPKMQPKAQLFVAQKRGGFLEGAQRFEGKKRQGALTSSIEDTINLNYSNAALAEPDVRDRAFMQAQQGVDLMIDSAPLPESHKEALRAKAAERAESMIYESLSSDPDAALDLLPRVEQYIDELSADQPLPPIQGGRIGAEGSMRDGSQSAAPRGPAGVQGLPGSPSGRALPAPQKLGAADVAPPQGQQSASYKILDTDAPSPKERNRIFREGGVVVNLDTNSGADGKPTTPMVVIPDNATKAQRAAAEAYAGKIAQLYRDKFGVELTPKVINRSVNGRGQTSTIHTEPYAVTDPKAVAYFQTPEGVAAHAQILRETFGTVPGVVFSIPHDPTGTGDHGAEANGVNEVALARLVLANLKGVAGDPVQVASAAPQLTQGPTPIGGRGLTQYAGMSKAGVAPAGLVEPGNIDLSKRTVVNNGDGSISTERSFSVNIDGTEVLLPRVIDGKVVSQERAIARYRETGGHLGKFKDAASATAYAQSLHAEQSQRYGGGVPRPPNTIPGPGQQPVPPAPVRVADASGRFVPQAQPTQPPRYIPTSSVKDHLRERLLKKLPAIQRQFEAGVGAAIGTVEEAAKKGYAIPPEQFERINKAVTKTESADLRIRLDKAVAGLEATRDLMHLAPAQVEQVAMSARARLVKDGILTATPDMIGRVEGVEGLAKAMRTELDDNPIGWGVHVGIIPEVTPITSQTLSIDVLGQRAAAGRAVADYYGQPPKFFLPEERTVLKGYLDKGGELMVHLLAGMNTAFGNDMPWAMKEISKDAPEAATLGWLISAGGDPQTVADASDAIALRATPDGDKMFKTLMPSQDQAREAAVATTGNAFRGLPGAEQRAMDLASLLYVVRAQGKGLSGRPDSWDAKLWQQGFNEVLGQTTDARTGVTYGGLAEQGGSFASWRGIPSNYGVKVVIPTNVRADALPELIDAIRITDLVKGGIPEGTPRLGLSISKNDEQAMSRAASAAKQTGTADVGALAMLSTRGAPIDNMGRVITVGTLRRATLVSIGEGRYWASLGDPMGSDPQWIGSNDTRDGRFVLDLKQLEPVLKQRVPSAYKDTGVSNSAR